MCVECVGKLDEVHTFQQRCLTNGHQYIEQISKERSICENKSAVIDIRDIKIERNLNQDEITSPLHFVEFDSSLGTTTEPLIADNLIEVNVTTEKSNYEGIIQLF